MRSTLAGTEHFIGTRRYLKFVPATGGRAGLMMFFHGSGGNACLAADESDENGWQARNTAIANDFVAVVATGSFPAGGGEPCCTWNDDVIGQDNVWNGVIGQDDVSYVQSVISQVTAAEVLSPSAPKIAIGFSGGAGMAADMGCYDSHWLWSNTGARRSGPLCAD